MKVYLNGHPYELKVGTQIERSPIEEFPANLRLVGQQRREDRSLISSLVISDVRYGFGVYRMDINEETDQHSFWDSELDTRVKGQIVLGAMPIAPSVTPIPSIYNLGFPFQWQNDVYFIPNISLSALQTNSLTSAVYRYNPTSNTIASHTRLYNGDTIPARGIFSYGGNIYAVSGSLGADSQGLYRSSGLGASAGGTTRLCVMGEAQIKNKRIYQIGNNNTDIFIVGINPGTTVSTNLFCKVFPGGGSANIVRMPSVTTIATYSLIAPLISSGLEVFLCLPEGIWDIIPTQAEAVVDSMQSIDNRALMTYYMGNILLKNFEDIIAVSPDSLNMANVGLTNREGLPALKRGEVTAAVSTNKYAFAAVKGATYSHIFSYDMNGWHFLSKVPSAGAIIRQMFISAAPDDILRLWLLYESGQPNFIYNPLVNPITAGTYNFMPTGHIEFPYFDGGLSEMAGGFYDIATSVDRVGTPHSISLLYGLDFAVPTQLLGNIATLSHLFLFGSPYGIAGRRIQPRLEMITTNQGTTPIFRDAVMHYYKFPTVRESFKFTLDLLRTSKREVEPLEQIIDNLDIARKSNLLMPFWYGRIATKNVRVMGIPALESIKAENIYQDEREGMVTVSLAELV